MMRLQMQRLMEALRYGAGLDYTYHPEGGSERQESRSGSEERQGSRSAA